MRLMRTARTLALGFLLLAGCSSNSAEPALRGDRCWDMGMGAQSVSCRTEACTFEGAEGTEVASYDFTLPETVLHVRTKAAIEFDLLLVSVSADMRTKLQSLDVKVNGVATTRLEAEPDHPERLRFAIPRVRKDEQLDVQMSSPESVKFALTFVDSTVTCRLRGL